MSNEEKKTEESAENILRVTIESINKYAKTLHEERALSYLVTRIFICGVNSLEAKEYHTKGMYTEEEVKKLIALKNMKDNNDEFTSPMGINLEESMEQKEGEINDGNHTN